MPLPLRVLPRARRSITPLKLSIKPMLGGRPKGFARVTSSLILQEQPNQITDITLITALLRHAEYKNLSPKRLCVIKEGRLSHGANGVTKRLTLGIPNTEIKFVVVLKEPTCATTSRVMLQHEKKINEKINQGQAPKAIASYLGEWEGRGLLYESYLEGALSDHAKDLREQLLGKDPSEAVATLLRLCQQMAGALAFLHQEANIAHRDIKASNIFVDQAFNFVLGDMGGAKELTKKMLAEVGDACTANYTSSELAFFVEEKGAQRSKALFHGNDVYALGVTLLKIINPNAFKELTHGDAIFSAKDFVLEYASDDKKFVKRVLGANHHPRVKALVKLVGKMLRPLKDRIHTADVLKEVAEISSEIDNQQSTSCFTTDQGSKRVRTKENQGILGSIKKTRGNNLPFADYWHSALFGAGRQREVKKCLQRVSANSVRFNQPESTPFL